MTLNNIFQPIPLDHIPLPPLKSHPVSSQHIVTRTSPLSLHHPPSFSPHPPNVPLCTNKFYANFFLGAQTCATWTHPYSLSWAKGQGNAQSWGLSVSHIDRYQIALGPVKRTGAHQYFINPIGIQSIILSAQELTPSARLFLDSPTAFSVNVNLSANPNSPSPCITFPILQGMGFVSAIYSFATPLFQSSVFFRTFTPGRIINNGRTLKCYALLEDNHTWLIYLTPPPAPGSLNLVNPTTVHGPPNYSGLIQVCKLSDSSSECEDIYDGSSGSFATSCNLSANVSKLSCTYTLEWDVTGDNPLLMFALNHHLCSFDSDTQECVRRPLCLQTTTKGLATAVQSNKWNLCEELPEDMDFAPWTPGSGSVSKLPYSTIKLIGKVAAQELTQDVRCQACLDSMYFSGKAMAKFAMILYVTHDVLHDDQLTQQGLSKLKDAYSEFVNNTQQNPLTYDETWKGAISTAGIKGDCGADFGNSWYNDHHFHYSYFVFTAALIGYIDKEWLHENNSRNTRWVNTLVKDYANSVTDNQFPFSRSFDWYHGHSWAKGLFESADGKDEESTSEDSFASYAIKMWGKVTRDICMERRGDLMLAIQARTFNSYFLMTSDNKVQPPEIIANKVTGILFENKIDHATYFGENIEYIQGIHMIPINPCTALIRRKKFVEEEWNTYFNDHRVDKIEGGWQGLIYANLALVQPHSAYSYFAKSDFAPAHLDGGASLTWYLAYTAALDVAESSSSSSTSSTDDSSPSDDDSASPAAPPPPPPPPPPLPPKHRPHHHHPPSCPFM